MTKLSLTAAAASCVLFGFAGTAGAAPLLLPNGAPSIFVLVEDEENAEVENLLDPAADAGTPMQEEGSAKPDAGDNGAEAKPEDKGEGEAKDAKDY